MYQRQLTERAALSETKDLSLIDVNLDLPLVNDVEVVALVALLDDDLPRHGRGGEHRVEDVRTLVLVQVAEQDLKDAIQGDFLANWSPFCRMFWRRTFWLGRLGSRAGSPAQLPSSWTTPAQISLVFGCTVFQFEIYIFKAVSYLCFIKF